MLVGRVRAVGGFVSLGSSLKYLKSGWNKKEGRGNKDFKKLGEAGSRGGCLKEMGAGTHSQTIKDHYP